MTKNTEPKDTKIEAQTTSYKKEIIIGVVVVACFLAIVATIALAVYNSTPKVVYQPAVACDMLSIGEAKELLGDRAINSNTSVPVQTSNTASSRCGYTDGNPNTQNMLVAAVIVRSGINDKGVQQNKDEFTNGTPAQAVEIVKDLGDSAYFNQTNGQLNVIKGRDWFIVSYGLGSAPELNTVEDAVRLAQKVLN